MVAKMRTCVRTKEHSCQDYTTIGVTKKGIRHGNYWWMRFKTHLLRLYLLEYNLFSCYNNGEVCVFIPILSYLFLNAIIVAALKKVSQKQSKNLDFYFT